MPLVYSDPFKPEEQIMFEQTVTFRIIDKHHGTYACDLINSDSEYIGGWNEAQTPLEAARLAFTAYLIDNADQFSKEQAK